MIDGWLKFCWRWLSARFSKQNGFGIPWAGGMASVLVGLLIVAAMVRPGTVVAQIDTFPIWKPWWLLKNSLAPYSNFFFPLGGYMPVGLSPMYAALGLLGTQFEVGMTQALLNALCVLSGFWGTYFLLVRLGCTTLAAWCVSWLYVFNSYATFNAIGLFSYGVLLAILPWFFVLLWDLAAYPERWQLTTFKIAILVAIPMGVVSATPQLVVGLFIVLLLYSLFLWRHYSLGPRFWRRASVALVVAMCVAGWWLLPNVIALRHNLVVHAVDVDAVAWTYRRASFFQLLRLLPMWTWQFPEYFPFARQYDTSWVISLANYIPAFGMALALAAVRGTRSEVRLFGGLALFGMFIAKGTHPPLEWVDRAFFHVPGLFMLLEPGTLLLTAALGMTVCCGLLVNEWYTARQRLAPWAAAFLGTSAFISGWPVLSGAVWHDASSWLPSMHVRLPTYWRLAAGEVNKHPGGVTLVLPENLFYQTYYDWGYGGVDVIPAQLIEHPVILPGSYLSYLVSPSEEYLSAALIGALHDCDHDLVPMLRVLGVSQVLLRGDVHRLGDDVPDYHPCLKHLLGQPITFGPLQLYRVTRSIPRLVVVPRADASASIDTAALASEVSTNTPDTTVKFLPARHVDTLNPFKPAFVTDVDTEQGANQVGISLFNATAKLVTIDLSMALPVERYARARLVATSYGSSSQVVISTAAPNEGYNWLTFRNLSLEPGISQVTVRWPISRSDAWADPWKPTDALRIGDLSIHVRSQGGPSHGPPWRVEILSTALLDQRLADKPELTFQNTAALDTSSGIMYGLAIHAVLGTVRATCWATLSPFPMDLASYLTRCVPVAEEEQNLLTGRLDRIDLVALIPPHVKTPPALMVTGTVTSTLWRKLPLVILNRFATANVPFMPVHQLGSGPWGAWLKVSASKGAVLVTDNVADPYLLVWDATHRRLLRSIQAGPMQAFVLSPGEVKLLYFNVFNLIEYVLFGAACVTLVIFGVWSTGLVPGSASVRRL